MAHLPPMARKDVRAEARRLLRAGFVYSHDTANNHHVFLAPSGVELVLPGTPAPYSGWVQRTRRRARQIMGGS
jgi:hypothetical protein